MLKANSYIVPKICFCVRLALLLTADAVEIRLRLNKIKLKICFCVRLALILQIVTKL